MNEFHGRASTLVEATPQAVFDLITDVDRLPEWNRAIEAVADSPAALGEGVEWTVTMHPPRMPRWGSISRVDRLDRRALRFEYETRNADGNPSRVKWCWDISPAGDGAEVTVSWDCVLRTLDRKLLAGPMRKRHLAREVPTSLDALADALSPTSIT